MTVKELIERLKSLDPDLPVIMSSDSEGNCHSLLAEVSGLGHYVAESAYSGTCLHDDDLPDYPEATPCVCLWPTR